MGNVVAFIRPGEPAQADGGTIHIWMQSPTHFEIGHESRSGDSWGSFDDFSSASAAIAGAVRLNHAQYGGRAAVHISEAIRNAALRERWHGKPRLTLDDILGPAFDPSGGAA